jgi:hypothetical protein
MTVKIATNIIRESDTIDYRTGKKVKKIFYPNGKIEIWEVNDAYEKIRQIK